MQGFVSILIATYFELILRNCKILTELDRWYTKTEIRSKGKSGR